MWKNLLKKKNKAKMFSYFEKKNFFCFCYINILNCVMYTHIPEVQAGYPGST